MKRLLFSLLVLAGCAAPRTHVESSMDVRVLDLSKYAEQGFLITPGPYGGDYETVAQLAVALYPEADRVVIDGEGTDREIKWVIGADVDLSMTLDSLYQISTERGADGIIYFETRSVPHPEAPGGAGVTGIEVSGIAIRRK